MDVTLNRQIANSLTPPMMCGIRAVLPSGLFCPQFRLRYSPLIRDTAGARCYFLRLIIQPICLCPPRLVQPQGALQERSLVTGISHERWSQLPPNAKTAPTTSCTTRRLTTREESVNVEPGESQEHMSSCRRAAYWSLHSFGQELEPLYNICIQTCSQRMYKENKSASHI